VSYYRAGISYLLPPQRRCQDRRKNTAYSVVTWICGQGAADSRPTILNILLLNEPATDEINIQMPRYYVVDKPLQERAKLSDRLPLGHDFFRVEI